MKFPVDLLADVSQTKLEKSAHEYMNTLLCSKRDSPECLTLPGSAQVTISISCMGFIPLYGQDDKPKILVLFSPSDLKVAIALYLLDRWWAVEDILKTADPARRGVLPVDTVGERIVLYILNRVIYREKERSTEEIPFLCHGENDHAKILWDDGEAVGFYAVNPTGSLYKRFSTRTYQLPVMGSIFVRKCHRGKGSGLLMLKDFVLSYSEASLGLKYPLSNSMYRVCEKYLCQYPQHADLLWEVESIGGPYQRTNIASKIQIMDLSAVCKSLSFTDEVPRQVTDWDVREDSITEQIKEATEGTVENTEETTVLRTTEVTDRRLSGSRQGQLEGKITQEHSEKVIRIEHIEAGAPRGDQLSVQQEMETHDLQTEGLFHSEETGQHISDTTAIGEEAVRLNKPHRDLGSRDSLKVSPATEASQDKITQEEHITSHDSPVEVEDVTSENEEAKEDSVAPVVYEEVFEVHTEVETLKQVDQGQILRRSTVFSTTTVERNYVQCSQKSAEETNAGNTFPTVGIVSELAGTDADPKESEVLSDDMSVVEEIRKEEEQLEDEQAEKKDELDVKDTVPQEISAEHPDTAETVDTSGQLLTEGQKLEEDHVSDRVFDDETEEPPVVQSRGRRKVSPKSTKHRQRKEEGKHTHEADPKAGRSLGGKEADEKAVDKPMEEHNQEDLFIDRTETSAQELLVVVVDGTTGAQDSEEDVVTSNKVRIEIKNDGGMKTSPEMDSEKQELADEGGEETDAVTADSPDQPTISVPDELDLTKDCEIPRLQHAKVVLVDLKTDSNHLSVTVAGDTTEVQCLASEAEELELTAAEKIDRNPEPSLLESTEEGHEEEDLEEVSGNKAKEDSSTQNHEEEEEAPFIETIHLRSGRKIVKVGNQERDHDDIASMRTDDEDHVAQVVPDEMEEEKEFITNDGVAGEDSAEEKQSAEEASTQPTINEETRLEEEEAPIHLQPSMEESKKNISGELEAEAEKESPDECTLALAEGEENRAEHASDPEEEFGSSKETRHSEEMDPQEPDLQRVTVVLVELGNSSQSQDQKPIEGSPVAEKQSAVEMEEQNMKEDGQTEAAADAPGEESAVSEEAATTETPQSVERDEAEGVSGVEEVPVVERRILRSGRKTGHTTTRRKGRRSAAATHQDKSKRAHTNGDSEEQETDETIPTLQEQTEEPKPDLEDVTQKEPCQERDVNEDNDGLAQEEDILQPHCEESEETSQDEPSIIGRSQRKAKRAASATRHKSKRSCMRRESEEETSAGDGEVEENKTDDGGIAEIENGDKSVDQKEEQPKDLAVVSAEASTGPNSETHSVGQEETSLSETASAPITVAEGDAEKNEATQVFGSNGNTVNASAGAKSLKCQIQENEQETVVGTNSGLDEAETEKNLGINAEEQVIEGEEEQFKIDGARDQLVDSESADPGAAESENINDESPVEEPETGTEDCGTSSGKLAEITETEVEPSTAPEKDLLICDEEIPTVTLRSRKSKTKRPWTTPKQTSKRQKKQHETTQEEPEDSGEPSQVSPTEEETDLCRREEEEALVKDSTAEDEAGLSEMVGAGGQEPSGFITAKEPEASDTEENTESDIVTMETEQENSSNSGLNTDVDEKELNSEVEENLSDDDGELIVMGKKVLRGRTVPALIITPHSKASRHRIKEFLSDEEKSPQSAQKTKLLKRKRTAGRPARSPRRRSRI